MTLDIDDEETCRLAGELARLTGETMTTAITVALRERLQREMRQRDAAARLQKMHAIANRSADLLRKGSPPTDHADLLYDEHGLPK